MTDLRSDIAQALSAFQTLPLKQAATDLMGLLGYKSDRSLDFGSVAEFCAQFDPEGKLDHPSALKADWKSVEIVFQLTDAELSQHASLFKETGIQQGLFQSYLFFAIELKDADYPRGKFSAIARQINRLFPMPVMLLIKHRDRLTIAVINRRRHKLDESKDVLGKVTLISGIHLATPHRGHLDILASLSVANLQHSSFKLQPSFDTLHAAWEQIFNVELLNARFYRELANWYFWALPQVEFPADLEPDDEKRRATGLIRLLTRLIFCWFLKEKNLIPEKLFHPTDLAKILKGFDPESETTSTYYLAILQNLFFATLNQRMGTDSKGKTYRTFAKDEGFQKNRTTYDVNNLYRYENLFAVSEEEALALFADIPFLNGGLFECLDQSSPDNPVGVSSEKTETGLSRLHIKKHYLDGFSRNAKKRPHVPDRLFFDSGETADLSAVYDDKKRKAEKVTGLITILNRYKFTIVENTPIDQEIALDPELLGKVFENLLASYNEETKTTARKQTGSIYTPRPIVDYMVDESLKAHLERKVAETILSQSEKVAETILSRSSSEKTETGLSLLPYNPDAPTEKTRANLPHWSQEGTTYWVTFRLADSLPQEKLKAWKAERNTWASHHPEPWSDLDWKEYHDRFGERLEHWLDAGEGKCYLRQPKIRSIVEKCLTHFDGDRYDLGPWVIMPNHVHLLLRPNKEQSLSKILQGIKGVSAKECNALLGRTGQTFWQEESFDHIVRSQAQFDRFVHYITDNPVEAKLREGEFSVAETILSRSSLSGPETRLSRLRSKLDHLFSYTDEPHQFTEPEVATLIAAIDALKILDPACGSGAFPMGVLHKLVYLLSKLDKENVAWEKIQLSKAQEIKDTEERRKAIAEIMSNFADNNDDYGRKLYLIENCLYGVDIQPIAIQITKLRFFISLVCDQKIQRSPDNPVGVSSDKTETGLSRLRSKNLGIRPLPNLETKFVAADTLIGLPESKIHEGELNLANDVIENLRKQLQEVRHLYFTAQNRTEKLRLQKRDKELREKLAQELAISYANDPATIKKLAMWNPYDPQFAAEFFEPQWMFGLKSSASIPDCDSINNASKMLALPSGSFDIVIGNPPYIDVKALPENAARLYFRLFTTAKNRINLYALFIEKGRELISNNGILSFIIPNSLLVGESYSKLRELILPDLTAIVKLPDGVFENAIVETMLLFVRRSSTLPTVAAAVYGNCEQIDFANVRYTSFPKSDWAASREIRFSIFSTEADDGICIKMEKAATLFEDVAEFCLGLTPYDKYKGHSPELIEERQFHSDRKLSAEYVPLISGTNITPYAVSDSVSEWLKYGPWLGAPRDRRFFTENRIIVRQIASGRPPRIFAGYTTKALYHSQIGFAIVAKKNAGVPLKLLLALLNSTLLNFYHGRRFLDREKITFQKVLIANVRKFPLAGAAKNVSSAILRLVDEILQLKAVNPAADTSALEREIDQQVYALYGLTPEEIAIVESTAP